MATISQPFSSGNLLTTKFPSHGLGEPVEGSTNLRHSNVFNHASGQPHKKSNGTALKAMIMKLADKISQERQQVITVGIANMQAGEREKMIKKFVMAYVIAK